MAEEARDPNRVPEVGEIVGDKYRVESVLGRGGMGIVVGARHEVLGQRVAIKLLTSPDASSTAVARFFREARATVDLRSEHVTRVLDVGTLPNGTPFLVMEHLEGKDLHKLLQQRGPLPVDEAVDFILQAADALAEAHGRGIVHRDLKPSNLFLTARADGTPLVKVLDFGISKLAPVEGEGELTETMAVLGSPGYMAPEQIKSARKVDQRADVWGLGIVLYRLLTAKNAFSGEGVLGLCAAILSDKPVPPTSVRPDLPPALEAIILRCLEKDPAARPQNVVELSRALVAFAPESSSIAARIRSSKAVTLDAPLSSFAARKSDAPPAITAVADARTPGESTNGGVQLPASRPPRKLRLAFAAGALLFAGAIAFAAFRTHGAPEGTPSSPPHLGEARAAQPTPSQQPASTTQPSSNAQPSSPPPAAAQPSASVSAAPSASGVAKVGAAKASPSSPVGAKIGHTPAAPKGSASWGKLLDDPL